VGANASSAGTDVRSGGHVRRGGAVSRVGYVVGALLLVVGLAGSLVWALASFASRDDAARTFARVDVGSVLHLTVDRPGTLVVFAEGTACLGYPRCHGVLVPVTVTVHGPAGGLVKVSASPAVSYDGGVGGTAVAQFEAGVPGSYRVVGTTGRYRMGTIAVGPPFPLWTDDGFAWAVLGVGLAGGCGMAMATFLRRRGSHH